MKTKLWLFGVLFIALSILTLAGCSESGAQIPATSAVTASTAPVNVNVGNQQGIWVNGEGIVNVTPDIAVLNLGVSAQAAKVADAQAQAAAAMDNVISTLKSNGVDPKDITTVYFSISPLTKYDNTTQQTTITGYQVTNTVSVKIRTIDKTGSIIDAVAAAAGDLIRINGISFSVDNPEQYYSQARTLAMNDAKAKARQLADLAGVSLGRPVYIAESSASAPTPVLFPNQAQAVPAPTTSISPGQTTITLDVQVAYSIQ
jgi:uncharacterized protein YggE